MQVEAEREKRRGQGHCYRVDVIIHEDNIMKTFCISRDMTRLKEIHTQDYRVQAVMPMRHPHQTH